MNFLVQLRSTFIFFGFLLAFSFTLHAQNRIGIECKGCDTNETGAPKISVLDSPQTSIVIRGSSGGYISFSDLEFLDSIKVFIQTKSGVDSTSNKVVGYSCIVQTKKGANVFLFNIPSVSPEIKEAATIAQNGDLIIFYNLIIRDEKGKETRIFSGPVFRIRK